MADFQMPKSRERKTAEPSVTIPARVPKSFAAAFTAKALENKLSRSEALYQAARAWMAAN